MSKNPITGDEIKSKLNTPEFEANFDNIFRKNKVAPVEDTADKPLECPKYNECECYMAGSCQEGWDENRIDTIGQNGNTGEHY
jgi:hypothetical protein